MIAEKVRNLNAELKSINLEWNSGINKLFPNDTARKIIDDRQKRGVRQINSIDANEVLDTISEISEIIDKKLGTFEKVSINSLIVSWI